METFTCRDCYSVKPVLINGGTGYATYGNDKVCYDCCATQDKKYMNINGKITLYCDGRKISNWPGSLVFHSRRYKEGKHNITGKRIDVWFTGPSNDLWHGVQYGRNTQLLHCKRVKNP